MKVQYPNNIKKEFTRLAVSHSNRGMTLESLLNQSNDYYIEKDIALIYKKPTPIGIVDVSYKNHKKIIEKAYFKEQSTLDYNGVYKGRYIDFDAKETLNKTSFPLSNIHPHQIEHIRRCIRHKGFAFLIIRMNGIHYLLTGEDLINYIDNNDRKSIEYKYIQEKAIIIKEGIRPPLDYLKAVDEIFLKENKYGK